MKGLLKTIYGGGIGAFLALILLLGFQFRGTSVLFLVVGFFALGAGAVWLVDEKRIDKIFETILRILNPP